MEDRDTRCNSMNGLVTVSTDKYERLVREAVVADTVKRLLMAKNTDYIDSTAIRIVLGIGPVALAPTKEGFDE